jgi:hypothetical protein
MNVSTAFARRFNESGTGGVLWVPVDIHKPELSLYCHTVLPRLDFWVSNLILLSSPATPALWLLSFDYIR